MDQVFNMGIGMVLVVSSYYADSVREQLARAGVPNWQIGKSEPGPQGVVWGEP
jgi:phosphoribosylformylglycinamidine cyclo-ligase